MEVKINVKDVFSDSFYENLPKNPASLYETLVSKSHSHSGITSPDLGRNGSGLTLAAKQPRVSLALFEACKSGKMAVQIGQRKGYKAYIFTF